MSILNNEEWRTIDGYENYQVSNTGQVKNIKTGRILVSFAQKTGYHSVILCREGKQATKYVHKLVAKAFIPNPENKKEVNHKNFRKNDNRVENLEWVTRQENMLYNSEHLDELKKQKILQIIVKNLLVDELGFTQKDIENILR